MPKQEKKQNKKKTNKSITEKMPVLTHMHIDISSWYRRRHRVHAMCNTKHLHDVTKGRIYSGAKIIDAYQAQGRMLFVTTV